MNNKRKVSGSEGLNGKLAYEPPKAMRLDDNRPVDDISVVVLRVLPLRGDEVRRMSVRLPIQAG